MTTGTRATAFLHNLGVNFSLHRYDYDPAAERIGVQAAESLGIEPRRLLKTLMAKSTASQCVSSCPLIAKSA